MERAISQADVQQITPAHIFHNKHLNLVEKRHEMLIIPFSQDIPHAPEHVIQK